MWHIKTISMKRQGRCTEQHAKVLETQEVALGDHRHGHEVHSSVEVGRAAHHEDQHGESIRCHVQQTGVLQSQEVDLVGLRHGH